MNFLGSLSSSAGLCRPARSPGKVGRSKEPGALSYSNMCFQTEESRDQRRRTKNKKKGGEFLQSTADTDHLSLVRGFSLVRAQSFTK
uniref:Uncharacterized protein n=1 Tax=Mastacembelus armatus TaxID=205130 RepID=A0A7N8XUL2_9TELE